MAPKAVAGGGVVSALVLALGVTSPGSAQPPTPGAAGMRPEASAVRAGMPPPGAEPEDRPAHRRSAGLPDDWRLRATSVGRLLIWRADRPLPITDALPEFRVAGAVVGYPRVSADGRTLRLLVAELPPARRDDVSVWLSGRRLDVPGQARLGGTGAPYVDPGPVRALSVDPGVHGPWSTASVDYRLPGRPSPGFPAPVEMLGHVVVPEGAPGDRPVVLFLHGRHATCYVPGTRRATGNWPCRPREDPIPSHLGYRYAQRLLASQGYVTVSVSANGINGQDYRALDGGAAARSLLVRRHLREWAAWASGDPGAPLAAEFGDVVPAVDLERLLLVGHSRGGEGVDRAAIDTRLEDPWEVDGQVLIGATAFGRQEAPYVPTVSMLPYCDGDVIDLQGQAYVDVGRDIGPDPALRSSLMVLGANHNFFNTEWTPGVAVAPAFDDWFAEDNPICGSTAPSRLSAAEQRAVGATYVAGAARLLLRGDERVLALYDGSRVRVPSAGDADVRSTALGGDRDVVRPGAGAVVEAAGAQARRCIGRSGTDRRALCGRGVSFFRTPHWPGVGAVYPVDRAVEVSWEQPGGRGGLLLNQPVDLSAATHLDARVVVATRPGAVELAVRLVDVTGAATVLTPAASGRLAPLPGGGGALGKLWAQTLRADLSATGGVDLTRIRRIELVGRSAAGKVWLLDVAGRRPGLLPLPVGRIARVNVGSVSTVEGDGPGMGVLEVPVTVDGALTRPARFRGFVYAFAGESGAAFSLRLAAGQTSAVIPVEFERDDLDDRDVMPFGVSLFPATGAMTADYLGISRVLDDDPTPRARFSVVERVVAEGEPLQWRFSLEHPVDYSVFYRVRAVRTAAGGRQLSTADVPRRWLRRHGVNPHADPRPLAAAKPYISAFIEAGDRTAKVFVPTVADADAEGREGLALRAADRRTLPEALTRAAVVTDP